MDTVSVVISTYNYANYVGRAIDSVLNQTYAAVELIVVNDGSTDNTSEVIQPYLSRIGYIEQANSGVVMARNRGAAEAKDAYLLFLDADDYLPPTFIADSVKVLSAHPEVDFVYGGREVFGAKNYRVNGSAWDPYLLLLVNTVGLSAMVRREAFESIGGFDVYFSKVKTYEDWDLWISLMAKGYQGIYLPGLFYYYQRLDINNRNKATVWQKAAWRWPVMWKHRSQYGWKFWGHLPFILHRSLRAKLKVLYRAQTTSV